MRFLFDENLSRTLVRSLDDLFPGSSQVVLAGLEHADDAVVWEYAREHGFTIVTKDADFYVRATLYGHPPKIVWLQLGNGPTREVEAMMRRHASTLLEFDQDEERAVLTLPLPLRS